MSDIDIDAKYFEWEKLPVDGVTRLQEQLVGVEAGTRVERAYLSDIVPGLLQTREYARGIFTTITEFHGYDQDIESAVEARMARQKVLHAEGHSFHYVFAERVLYMTVGDDATMADQLERLLGVIGSPHVYLGGIPHNARLGCYPTSFHIRDDIAVSIEALTAHMNITEPREIAVYLRGFDALSRAAATGEDARKLIRAALATRVG